MTPEPEWDAVRGGMTFCLLLCQVRQVLLGVCTHSISWPVYTVALTVDRSKHKMRFVYRVIPRPCCLLGIIFLSVTFNMLCLLYHLDVIRIAGGQLYENFNPESAARASRLRSANGRCSSHQDFLDQCKGSAGVPRATAIEQYNLTRFVSILRMFDWILQTRLKLSVFILSLPRIFACICIISF